MYFGLSEDQSFFQDNVLKFLDDNVGLDIVKSITSKADKNLQQEIHSGLTNLGPHDLPVIRQMCNRIVVLKDGNVCEINDSESLFNQPQHSYTKQLINLMPKIESLV